MIIYKCDQPPTGSKMLRYKLVDFSLGYDRKMTYIYSSHSPYYYRVEELDGYFYFPYLSLSGFCVRINEKGEVAVFVRGKKQETHRLNTPAKIQEFFDTLDTQYMSYQCLNRSSGFLIVKDKGRVYNWDCDLPCDMDEIYVYDHSPTRYSQSSYRRTIIKEASILDACALILGVSSREYFIFDFDGAGEFAFTRDEVLKYKTTNHL